MKVFIILALIIAITLISFLERVANNKRMKLQLKESYGKKADGSIEEFDRRELAALYYNVIKKTIPEDELLDDITWDDLEMDNIFCCMNTTKSFIGEQVLFAALHRLPKEKNWLYEREKIIKYYDEHPEERVEAQARLLQLRKEDYNYYIPVFMDTLESQRLPFTSLCRILQITLVLLMPAAVITMNPVLVTAAAANFLINIAIYAMGKNKYELLLESLYAMIRTVKTADVLCCADDLECMDVKDNLKKLEKVKKLVSILERKKQGSVAGDILALIYDYIIGAFLWDFTIYDKLIRLLSGRQREFMQVYRYVGELDLSIAVGSFRRSLPFWCEPEFSEKQFSMEGICHPLIEDAVENSFTMEKNMILTGSNASGKSTFVKAAAINIILGQCIHTCTARSMVLPNAGVLTSMAVRDDILSGESYYIKEIKYLQRMIEKSSGERMVFCGIDEILRGTNTMERVAASIAILSYLCEKNCMVMVATHDVDLATALDGPCDNYYFCESVQDGDVVFDYKLRKGISNTQNAIRLLEAVGFPAEIIAESKKRCGMES